MGKLEREKERALRPKGKRKVINKGYHYYTHARTIITIAVNI